MAPEDLLFQLGIPLADDVLRGIVGIFAHAFPGRIRAAYLVGSYADGSAVALSDLDIRLVFRGAFQEGEEDRFRQMRDSCRLLSPIEIDMPPLSEDRLQFDPAWMHEVIDIGTNGRLLYGRELRSDLPIVDFETYFYHLTDAPLMFMSRVHQVNPLRFPLDYPEPVEPLYGYDGAKGKNKSLKMLVHIAGFVATCLIGMKAGRIVTKKKDWLPMYRVHIDDEWTSFLATLYGRCKEEWGYIVPTEDGDLQFLRETCRQALRFEELYAANNDRQIRALRRLRQVIYRDARLTARLENLAAQESGLGGEALETLRVYQEINES